MVCKNIEKCSLDFIMNRLSDDGILELERHIAGCPKCEEAFAMNYAIYTAISQLEQDEDFSDNYHTEAMERLSGRAAVILRHRKGMRIFRAFSLIFIMVIGILLGFTNSDTFRRSRLPSGSPSSFGLGFYGISEEKDPVNLAIRDYNSEMISWLHNTHDSFYDTENTENTEGFSGEETVETADTDWPKE